MNQTRPSREPWYQSTPFLAVALVVCFPVGLVLMWLSPTWSRWVKTAVTAGVVVLCGFSVVAGRADPKLFAVPPNHPTAPRAIQARRTATSHLPRPAVHHPAPPASIPARSSSHSADAVYAAEVGYLTRGYAADLNALAALCSQKQNGGTFDYPWKRSVATDLVALMSTANQMAALSPVPRPMRHIHSILLQVNQETGAFVKSFALWIDHGNPVERGAAERHMARIKVLMDQGNAAAHRLVTT